MRYRFGIDQGMFLVMDFRKTRLMICVAILPILLIAIFVSTGLWAKGERPETRNAEMISLGERLFFDASLSSDGQTRCAACHQPEHAFADSRATARGAFGRIGTRNTPSLLALTDEAPLFWDGRRSTLEAASFDPLIHPREMGHSDENEIIAALSSPSYRAAFARAFGTGSAGAPGRETVSRALSAYIRNLPRPPVPFDRYVEDKNPSSLSREAREGFRLFTGKAGCDSCHKLSGKPVQFTDHTFHPTGTGLQTLDGQLPLLAKDVVTGSTDPGAIGRLIAERPDLAATGRFSVTHEPSDLGLFRTPSLRYVADTAPYMHDGSVPTLEAAVDQEIYWRSLSSGHPISLTVSERASLIAFLQSISLNTGEAPPSKSPD
ncbi:cytochrome c peroxidase [Luteibacter sp. Sphag1AF]|uniref:cytochrome-c peroxidase n=1 Tax=Luteibacter sp. Sphag1AF TaxID=2587031 RepID=UPI001608182F|nr:cytochrome c peroxidase [Luteibacter sp. Sphag1AF]MBB3226233.1 cytochrome c peroxidase [Luteibacter sp. Sphag1AF]